MSDGEANTVHSTLRNICGVCDECILLLTKQSRRRTYLPSSSSPPSTTCNLCLGILSDPSFLDRTLETIRTTSEPYGGLWESSSCSTSSGTSSGTSNKRHRSSGEVTNGLCRDAPTIVPPALILIRAVCVLGAVENAVHSSVASSDEETSNTNTAIGNKHKEQRADSNNDTNNRENGDRTDPTSFSPPPPPPPPPIDPYHACWDPMDVYTKIKERFRDKIRHRIDTLRNPPSSSSSDPSSSSSSNHNDQQQQQQQQQKHDTPIIHQHNQGPNNEEEAGYLNYHILITPDLSSLTSHLPPSTVLPLPSSLSNGFQRKRERKRFRGNDPTEKQGGDPRTNLEKRVRALLEKEEKEEKEKEERDTVLIGEEKKKDTMMGVLKGDDDERNNKTHHRSQPTQTFLWLLEKKVVGDVLHPITNDCSKRKRLGEWFVQNVSSRSLDEKEIPPNDGCCHVHVACWRNKFYLHGRYTKARRDVSQTPFYVPVTKPFDDRTDKSGTVTESLVSCTVVSPKQPSTTNGGGYPRMVKKGVSSVEEEICPIVARVACGSISTANDEPLPITTTNSNADRHQKGGDIVKGGVTSGGNCGGVKGRIVYGMCKFHASGREDMDVRMALPWFTTDRNHQDGNRNGGGDGGDGDGSGECSNSGHGKAGGGGKGTLIAGGRPFVCEVVDALRMPTKESLRKAVSVINCTPEIIVDDNYDGDGGTVVAELELVHEPNNQWLQNDKEGEESTTPTSYLRCYGRNPNGVGISSLSYCPSSFYRTLQSKAEEKVKFYGCLCWSADCIPSQDYLDQRLVVRSSIVSENNNEKTKSTASSSSPPRLQLQQKTPLRVLHRRSTAVRTKYILSMRSIRINNHWFRLHLSTSAGTYVKEFVHGDCGRTVPSVSSLLGCKTDIVELDCEGVAV